jgi:hypothetical protein
VRCPSRPRTEPPYRRNAVRFRGCGDAVGLAPLGITLAPRCGVRLTPLRVTLLSLGVRTVPVSLTPLRVSSSSHSPSRWAVLCGSRRDESGRSAGEPMGLPTVSVSDPVGLLIVREPLELPNRVSGPVPVLARPGCGHITAALSPTSSGVVSPFFQHVEEEGEAEGEGEGGEGEGEGEGVPLMLKLSHSDVAKGQAETPNVAVGCVDWSVR